MEPHLVWTIKHSFHLFFQLFGMGKQTVIRKAVAASQRSEPSSFSVPVMTIDNKTHTWRSILVPTMDQKALS